MKIITSEDVGLAEPTLPASIAALFSMYHEQKKKKDEKNKPERLFLVHAVLLLVRAKKSRLVDWSIVAYWNEHETTHLPIPDYAFDKHTKTGRTMGRGMTHFWTEGARLENRADIEGEDEMKERARQSEEVRRHGH
jgi:replication-associated recombination protein RarA